MKMRSIAGCVAALLVSSLAFAGNENEQAATKNPTAVGVIVTIGKKSSQIVVSAQAAGDQIQTQKDPDGKAKRQWTFRVTDETQVVFAKGAKGKPDGGKTGSDKLAVGQYVRVTYAAGASGKQRQNQSGGQDQDQNAGPAQDGDQDKDQKQGPGQDGGQDKNAQSNKGKGVGDDDKSQGSGNELFSDGEQANGGSKAKTKVLEAKRIEILRISDKQQDDSDKQQNGNDPPQDDK